MTSTPLDQVWDLPLGLLFEYASRLDELVPIYNPFAQPAEATPEATPETLRALKMGFGL